MVVVDTSAVLAALVADPPNPRLCERLSEDGDLHAPHLVDVEFIHALRRLVRRRELSLDRAEAARKDFADLLVVRYPHEPLMERMWELRDNVTAYDAAFLALAETLGVPLITVDERLARSSLHSVSTEVF